MAKTRSKILTEDDRENAMTYGLCRQCGYPRTARIKVSLSADGTEVFHHNLVCTRDETHKAFG